MARESREVWTKRVERWRDSGLSAKEFADETGVKANTLQNWGYRLAAERRRAQKESAPKSESVEWIEVTAPTKEREAEASSERLELVLASGLTVRVPARFEAAALRRLLAVVG
jgi:hypothetical protein